VSENVRPLLAALKKKLADYPLWLKITVLVFSLFILYLAAKSFAAKDWLSAFGTLVASFIGEWFAFSFARYQRDQERIENEISAGNRALFILTRMYNETRQYQKEVVAPYRGKQDAWLNLNIGPRLSGSLSFDLKDLSFVLDADPAIFADVILEEVRHSTLANLIDRHSELILRQVWPRLEDAGLKIGDASTQGEVEEIIGPSAASQLKTITSGIIHNCDENEKSLRVAFSSLPAVLKKSHPDRKFIDFKPGP
jgi:hypothetical protein